MNADSLLEPISVEDWLPVDRTWVLAHYNGDNWGHAGGQYWVVAMFVRGLSITDREALPVDDSNKDVWKREDEYGNNQRPYCWNEFGSGMKFGQEVDYWMTLPEIPTEPTTVNIPDESGPDLRAKQIDWWLRGNPTSASMKCVAYSIQKLEAGGDLEIFVSNEIDRVQP